MPTCKIYADEMKKLVKEQLFFKKHRPLLHANIELTAKKINCLHYLLSQSNSSNYIETELVKIKDLGFNKWLVKLLKNTQKQYIANTWSKHLSLIDASPIKAIPPYDKNVKESNASFDALVKLARLVEINTYRENKKG